MLDLLRTKSKHIIWATAIIFIAGMAFMAAPNLGSRKSAYVGEIFGDKISYNEFYELSKTEYGNFQQQNPDREIDERALAEIRERAWNNLVQRKIFDRAIKKMHIKVTDAEVIEKIKNDPPAYIKEAEIFKTDGKFDKEKYLNAVVTNEPVNMDWLEEQIRASLPYQKLIDEINAQVEVTDDEVKEEFILQNDLADVKTIYFDSKKADKDTVTPTDAEMKEYYEKNKDEKYEKGPSRKYKYVRIALEPSASDKKEAEERANEAYNRAVKGEDFGELAKELSEGPSAPKGGDLGYFAKNKMVKPFSDAAFAMKKGEISKPVETRFGFHVIKVFDKKKNKNGEEEVKASHILIEVKPSEETKEKLQVKAEEFFASAEEDGIDKAAENMKYDVKETSKFLENSQYISGMGKQPALVSFAFENKVGAMPEPVKTEKGDFFISEISFAKGTHIEEFEEVKNRVKSAVSKEKKLAWSEKEAQKFVKDNTPDKYFKVAEKTKLTVNENKGFKGNGSLKGIGKNEDNNKIIFETAVKSWTKPLKGNNGYYIANLISRTKPDMKKFDEEKESIRKTLTSRKENKHYREWYDEQKAEAHIIDNRAKFF